MAFACAATLTLAHAAAPPAPPAPADMTSIPMSLPPWSGTRAPDLDPEVAEVLAADEYIHRYYTGPGERIEMDVAYYGQPRVGATMHSPLNCLPGNGWEVTSSSTAEVATGSGTWPIRKLAVRRGDVRYVLAYWFQGRDRVVAHEVTSRAYLLADALRRRPTATGLVRLIIPADAAAAEPEALGAFAARLMPEIAIRLD